MSNRGLGPRLVLLEPVETSPVSDTEKDWNRNATNSYGHGHSHHQNGINDLISYCHTFHGIFEVSGN